MRSSLHRLIWQRLPRTARRSTLFNIMRITAPRPTPGARPAEPIIVVGCLRAATGLGQSARLCYEALSAEGFEVRGIDVSSLLMQPVDFPAYSFRDGSSQSGRGTLLVHVNAPYLPFVLWSLGRRIVSDKWVVGYWAWELPAVPLDWKFGFPFVHEIWVPSRFVATAVATRVTNIPIRVIAHPVAVAGRGASALPRQALSPFTALTIFDMGSSIERKNPIAAITAFKTAFGDHSDSRMIVKVTNAGLFPDGERRLRNAAASADNVTIIDHTLQPSQLAQLYSQAHCLVSLHRAEGFGLTVAEAMLHGVPTLSTDWSGTTDFVTTATGRPVPYRLVPARDPQDTYDYPDQSWAEADTAAAATMLQELRDHAGNLGERARDNAMRRFSAAPYAAMVRKCFAEANARF